MKDLEQFLNRGKNNDELKQIKKKYFEFSL